MNKLIWKYFTYSFFGYVVTAVLLLLVWPALPGGLFWKILGIQITNTIFFFISYVLLVKINGGNDG